jgi:hypothetical protein
MNVDLGGWTTGFDAPTNRRGDGCMKSKMSGQFDSEEKDQHFIEASALSPSRVLK